MTLADAARSTIASLPAPLRWRVRNVVALARWLGQRATGAGEGAAYAADFWALHHSGDWDRFAQLILRSCAPRSLVDVGCGDGKLLAAIRRIDPALPMLGIDGSPPALARAASLGLPVWRHDLSSTRASGRDRLRQRIGEFDVAVSLETAEHLPPWAGRHFVESLGRVRLVVFSAAAPGQGGTLHMNERPAGYWQRQFFKRGYVEARSSGPLRDAVAQLDLPPWYGANIHLFERRA